MRHSKHYMGVQVSLEKASWDIAESSGKLIKTQTAESQPKVLGRKMCVFNKFLTLHFENPPALHYRRSHWMLILPLIPG